MGKDISRFNRPQTYRIFREVYNAFHYLVYVKNVRQYGICGAVHLNP